jgi:hypothetical protein
MFAPHTIDRFASPLNTLLLRYNANSLKPRRARRTMDSLHLADTQWREENCWCNPPWPLLPDWCNPPLPLNEKRTTTYSLPRSENSYVNYETLLTLISRNYQGILTLPVPSSPPGRFMTSDGPLVCASLRSNGQRTPSQHGYNWHVAQYMNNLRTVSRGLRTPYKKVQLQHRTISVPRCKRSSPSAVGHENRT